MKAVQQIQRIDGQRDGYGAGDYTETYNNYNEDPNEIHADLDYSYRIYYC